MPEHAEYVMSFWPYSSNTSSRVQIGKYNIMNLHSVAVFHQDDLSTPVAWAMQSSVYDIMHLYTVEAHRRKHLAEFVVAKMCEVLLEDDYIPFCGIEEMNIESINLFQKVGFVIDGENSTYFRNV